MKHSEFNIKDYPDVALKGPNHRYLTEGLFVEYGNPDAVCTLRS